MVRFEYQQVGVSEVEPYGVRYVAKICDQSDLHSVCFETERDWINGIMWNRKAADVNVADRESSTSTETV